MVAARRRLLVIAPYTGFETVLEALKNLQNYTDLWASLIHSSKNLELLKINSFFELDFAEAKSFGTEAQDFILLCSFDGQACDAKNVKVFQNKKYGNCFSFNHGTGGSEIIRTERTGATSGLSLVLNTNQSENFYSDLNGARLVISNPFEFPFPQQNGINLGVGVQTQISIKQHEITRTKLPYGGQNCSNDFL